MNDQNSSNSPKPPEDKFRNAAGFGWTMIAEFLVCFFGGYYLDIKLQTGMLWTFVGLGLAVALIAYELWKLTRN